MKKIALDGKRLIDKIEAHEYLKEMLDFPEHYGKNLDALYDCLTDLDEIEITIESVEAGSACLKGILRVFTDAAEENRNLKVSII